MKILLSCFACAPYKGSEPGVGWNWAMELAKENEVCVLTRLQNKEEIEKYLNKNPTTIKFEYFGIAFFEKIKKFPFRENFYAMLWQKSVVKYAMQINDKYNFDLCHHCTYASFKYPSRLYKLNIPLIIGPVGGGEVTPKSCKSKFSLKGRIKEAIHDWQIVLMKNKQSTRKMFSEAAKILVATEETLNCVPEEFKNKTHVMQTIAIDESEIIKPRSKFVDNNLTIQILYVGQLKEWKGLRIIVDIAAILKKEFPGMFNISVIGEGPDKKSFIRWIKKENVEDVITLLGNVSRSEVLNQMSTSHIFLFPSFHDSGAMVVLEAIASGLPVLVLEAGGPAINAKMGEAYIINASQDYEDIIKDFVRGITELRLKYIEDSNSLEEKLISATSRIHLEGTWKEKAKIMNRIYKEII